VIQGLGGKDEEPWVQPPLAKWRFQTWQQLTAIVNNGRGRHWHGAIVQIGHGSAAAGVSSSAKATASASDGDLASTSVSGSGNGWPAPIAWPDKP